MPRIVSLIASATEIVCALGAGDRLVGRSHECDFPADVLDLPALTDAATPTVIVDNLNAPLFNHAGGGLRVWNVKVRYVHVAACGGVLNALAHAHADAGPAGRVHRPRCCARADLCAGPHAEAACCALRRRHVPRLHRPHACC